MTDAGEASVLARWGHSQCHALTLALHERTGWPILTLHDGRVAYGQRYLDQCGDLLHSGVVMPDGSFLDIRGICSPERMDEVASRYLADVERARWSHDIRPDARDLAEMLDRHDLLVVALEEAHSVVDGYLVEKTGIVLPAKVDAERPWLNEADLEGSSRSTFRL